MAYAMYAVGGVGCAGCGVAYVKLVPLSGDESAAVVKDRGSRSNRRLAVTCDGSSWIGLNRATTVEELLKEIAMLRDTDFGTVLLHIGGSDQPNYPSPYGNHYGHGMTDFAMIDERFYAEACRILAEKNINPTKVV